jgi:magnesium-transporting ATPase (P-type)
MAQTMTAPAEVDERQPPTELFRHLRSTPDGLRSREAARRLTVYGPNELSRRARRRWPRQLLAQFTQPLVVFSGTSCTAGQARAVVTHTGMHSEIRRIAALSRRGQAEPSPLERQVRRATWIIAAVAVSADAAFLLIGVLAGLGWAAAISFSIGLIVANVPDRLRRAHRPRAARTGLPGAVPAVGVGRR